MKKNQAKTPGDSKGYTYNTLRECAIGQSKLHFYAVILDAQFPHKSFKSEKYVLSLKIADQSCTIDRVDGTIDFCTLVLFANKFEDLPISQRVGDIIRVHRAGVSEFKGNKQFTANIFFNSSWAIFAPAPAHQPKEKRDVEFRPFMFFGKQLSFENSEMKILRALRKWTNTIFDENAVLSNQFITDLSHLSVIQNDDKHFDFDLSVKILQLFKLDDFTSEMRVIDNSHQIWHTQILNQKFKWLEEGQCIRIRQATLQNHKNYHRVFGIKSHSNIMSLPEGCKLVEHQTWDEGVESAQFEKEQIKAKIQTDAPLAHPIVLTKLLNRAAYDFPVKKLASLLDPNNTIAPGIQSRCRLSAVASIPDISEESKAGEVFPFLKIYNQKTGQCRQIGKSDKPKQNEKVAIFVQLLCKDVSTANSGNFVKMNIIQENSTGFFPGINPADLLSNNKKSQEAQLQIRLAIKVLMRFNAYIEALVKIVPIKDGRVYVIENTQVKTFD